MQQRKGRDLWRKEMYHQVSFEHEESACSTAATAVWETIRNSSLSCLHCIDLPTYEEDSSSAPLPSIHGLHSSPV